MDLGTWNDVHAIRAILCVELVNAHLEVMVERVLVERSGAREHDTVRYDRAMSSRYYCAL